MDEKVRQLMAQINVLEDELRAVLHRAEVPLFYRLDGKRIKFDHTVREAHRRSKTGLLRWLVKSRPPTIVVAPVIYGLILPLLFLDLGLTAYQTICFPVYRINKVKRSDYIVMDRWHLSYLNFMEKFNCAYCAYANGLLAYGTEIAARTEQYWCPIKHARKMLGASPRVHGFLAYGDGENYEERLSGFREALATDTVKPDAPDAPPSP
ncbi:hypothetical protein M0D69_36150 [Caballeronia sp. SEWSISQ10-4 2]|uniref:hypothetical protein n=1 Tax=Caballeronia sp. SEWSISQ10-4 2 TaxID=2937438 RepID=UPI00265076A4|nr:hypothetical protein [Caballeronia sp. SEWSISQ10-4 2]MDN7183352.1 hypothetical protein [Caballeronia sp. SEWSISQ10-4 2]